MTATQVAADAPSARPMQAGLFRGHRLTVLGLLVLQLTWVFCVPPFRSSDEFDHVYKAAAVARGEWFPAPAMATRGTGAWLEVPRDIVDAARPQCEALDYTRDEDCIGTRHGDTVRIASGAGRYHPLYYAIVGTPALPFEGHAAVYVMRLVTVLITWLLFCIALGAVRTWARTAWPTALTAAACTPVLVFSASVVAPNGVELMAAVAFWCSLLAIARDEEGTATRLALVFTAISGGVLLTTRSLGPLWCLMIILTVLVATPGRWVRLRDLMRRRTFWLAATAMLVVASQSTVWILGMGSLDVGESAPRPLSLAERMSTVSKDIPLWMFQSVAAFPRRNEGSEPVVYACYAAIFIGVLVMALRAGRGSARIALVGAMLASVAVPFAIATLTYNDHVSVWQGRYGLPYAVGTMLLAGLALDSARRPLDPRLRGAGLLLFVTAHSVAPVDVLRRSMAQHVSDADQWIHPAPALAAALAVAGSAALWWGASRSTGEFSP